MIPVRWMVEPGTNAGGAPRWVETVVVGQAHLHQYATTRRGAEDEATLLAQRFQCVAAQAANLRKLAVATLDGNPTLFWDGKVVHVFTPAAAREEGHTPQEVASAWLGALRKVRPLAGISGPVSIPEGDDRRVVLLPGWTVARGYDRTVVGVSIGGRAVRLHGGRAGRTALTLRKGKLERTVAVQVMPLAGVVPYSLHWLWSGPYDRLLAVTGLERALAQKTTAAPGAGLSSSWPMLPSGAVDKARVTVWAEGKGLASQVRNVLVTTAASTLTVQDAAHLVASNNPEMLTQPGTLLDQALSPGTSWYYYHHHNNGQSAPRVLNVTLQNEGREPARLLVAHSAAGPTTDEIYVGHLATWRFLHWEQAGNGWEVEIPPGGSYPLDRRFLAKNEITAGLGLLQLASGSDVHLVVKTDGGGTVDDPKANRAVRARGLYPAPERALEASYAAKGPWAFVSLGGPPYGQSLVADEATADVTQPAEESLPNYGNYGVLYHVKLHLSNPTTESQRVFAVFAAGGGPARGSLRVDGKFEETPVVGANPGQMREAPLSDWTLDPGQSRDVDLLAIPEPGSNYPVRIIVKNLPANR